MLELIGRQEMFFFLVALMLTVLFFILEMVSLIVGGTNEWTNALLPDGVGLDAPNAGVVVGFLNWLYVGRVPLLMVLIIFWTVFGVLGLILQNALYLLIGQLLPSLVAVPAVLMLSLPVVRFFTKWLYKVLPKDETSAVYSDELIGRVGTIVIGTATCDKSAQAKVKDLHGQTHYVMVVSDDEPLTQGQSVLLIAKNLALFTAIKNPNATLTD